MKKQIIKLDFAQTNVLGEQEKNTPDDQEWLLKPENKEAFEKVKEGLHEKGTIDRGSFSEYLEEK